MDLSEYPLIHDVFLFAALRVSNNTGRKRVAEMAARKEIEPVRTPTNRKLLSFRDAEKVAASF